MNYIFTNEPEGQYQVKAKLLSKQNLVLANAQTTYLVEADNLQNLSGTTKVQVSSLRKGQAQICTDTVKNIGDIDLSNITVQQTLLDVSSKKTLNANTQEINLTTGIDQTLIRSISTSGLNTGDYVCILQANINGKLRTLDFAAFSVTEPPIRVDGELALGAHGKLLVWLDHGYHHEHQDECRDKYLSDDNDKRGGKYTGYYKKKNTYQCTNDNNDNDKQKHNEQCVPQEESGDGIELAKQRKYLKTLLFDAGWNYTLVEHRNDFIDAFSSGGYQAYMIFNAQENLGHDLEKALREAVYRGEGLIIGVRQHYIGSEYQGSRYKDRFKEYGLANSGRYHALTDALGIEMREQRAKPKRFDFVENNLLQLTGAFEFEQGKQTRGIKLKQAQAILQYESANCIESNKPMHSEDENKYASSKMSKWSSTGKYKNDDDNNKDDEKDDKYKCEKSHYQSVEKTNKVAVSFNQYGKGKALFVGFDVLRYATNYQDKTLLNDLINVALLKTHPQAPLLFPANRVPINATIDNMGSDAQVNISLSAPENSQWEIAEQGSIIPPQALWQYPATVGSERTLRAWANIPQAGGDAVFQLRIEAGVDSSSLIEQQIKNLSISAVARPMLTEIIEKIEELQSQGATQKNLQRAKKALEKAEQQLQKNKTVNATRFVLKATDKLVAETDKDIIDIRLQIDQWLRRATLKSESHNNKRKKDD